MQTCSSTFGRLPRSARLQYRFFGSIGELMLDQLSTPSRRGQKTRQSSCYGAVLPMVQMQEACTLAARKRHRVDTFSFLPPQFHQNTQRCATVLSSSRIYNPKESKQS